MRLEGNVIVPNTAMCCLGWANASEFITGEPNENNNNARLDNQRPFHPHTSSLGMEQLKSASPVRTASLSPSLSRLKRT
jgi:hypothetical protein